MALFFNLVDAWIIFDLFVDVEWQVVLTKCDLLDPLQLAQSINAVETDLVNNVKLHKHRLGYLTSYKDLNKSDEAG